VNPNALPGVKVKIVSSDHGLTSLGNNLIGRTGVTERPEAEGCYVRFPDGSYVYCWWSEIEEEPT
jgi:hypothetical protein